MKYKIPALLISKNALKSDPALQIGARGARKFLVTEIFSGKEEEASDIVWVPPTGKAKCPVQVMPDTEVAIFTQQAPQDRHRHQKGTEIYMVLEGRMVIEVEGQDHILSSGDMIVVNPGAVHEVKPSGTQFLCRVVTINCGGASDKFLVHSTA